MADPGDQSRANRESEPRGERPRPFESSHQLECVEWCPICRTADVLRATAPPELRDQWQSVQREALLTMRSLIDTYLERIDDSERSYQPRVQEIPIE
jgi:hypothetical protein